MTRFLSTLFCAVLTLSARAETPTLAQGEVHRGKLETPMLLPPTQYKVSDKKPMPSKADNTSKDKKEENKSDKAANKELPDRKEHTKHSKNKQTNKI